MKNISFIVLILWVVNLTACHEADWVAAEDVVPSLRSFDLIDSYDQDTSAPSYAPLALNPYEYDGLFEVFWRANSLEDYTVTFWVNDRPSFRGAIPFHSEVCGAGRWCDQGGSLVCEYTSDFYLSCDNSAHEADIASLFSQVPQLLYVFAEVCDVDSDYCEYDYYPVTFE